MGYLSQRKNKKRQDRFMSIATLLLGVATFMGFLNDSSGSITYYANIYRLHLYIITFLLFILAIGKKYTFCSVVLGLFLVVNYFFLAATINFFTNDISDSGPYINIVYKIDASAPEIVTHEEVAGEGLLHLNQRFVASYKTIEKNYKKITLIAINLKDIENHELENVFSNLAEFTEAQDNPVVIVGDFGIPAWMDISKRFLEQTQLFVKNRLIFCDGKFEINPFKAPSVNVLAYKNAGLQKIEFLDKDNNSLHPINIELSVR